MKNIKNVRKAVATMANRINKKLNDLSAVFKKAWAIIKGRIQSKVSGVTYGQSQKALYRLAKYNPEAVNVELIHESSNAVSVHVSVNTSRTYKLGYLP